MGANHDEPFISIGTLKKNLNSMGDRFSSTWYAKAMVKLRIVSGVFAICRLPKEDSIPLWATESSFYSVTKTTDELSVVCEGHLVPPGIPAERDWRMLQVEGPLPFHLTGILSALTAPLADAKISIFAVSTFDTDYLLVKSIDFERAREALDGAGFLVPK